MNTAPAWSPDGSRLAYTRSEEGSSRYLAPEHFRGKPGPPHGQRSSIETSASFSQTVFN
ncbi:MAG: hypothetical protein MZU79_08750 [Anaerotruncus sp.]|nr:hypothetical protein [Anaerotruncus sp.]